jgi:hypothetical protein
MDVNTTPPPIPSRARQHTRRKSLQGPSAHSSNRVHVQPASPEVISSLITSLSIISSPANQLFENPAHSSPASPTSTNTTFNTFGHLNGSNDPRSSVGSFGIDYGAYEQPSLRELIEEESLDELAASPPVVRTAKPPSGFSPLTAPRSPQSSPLKTFLRGSSRPSSKGSTGSKDKDDASSIGNLSIEPGIAPAPELRRKSSSDSWGKKQARNQRGLMYMSSKERLREKEQERKRASVGAVGGNTKGLGLDRIPLPQFDSDSFMAENAIGEEPEESSPSNHTASSSILNQEGMSPALSTGSQGGIGSGRFIPTRDSSLRKPATNPKKRNSQKPNRQSGKQKANDDADDTIHELEEQQQDRKRERSKRDHKSSEATSKMMEPLDNLEMPMGKTTTLASKQVLESAKVDQLRLVENAEEGAPSPAVAQRKARPSPDRGHRSSSQRRRSGKVTPEPLETPQPKRAGSRLKRLSAPLSPRASDRDSHQRSSSNPLSRVGSPEPARTAPQIHVDDRPTSADSIDDAVEAYLCSPRLSQKIRHPQTGRTISFSEVGDSEGFAVFCCVGMGLTRYITAFYDELALTLKLRLITPDRPGVGDSEPYNDGTATPLSWPGTLYWMVCHNC